MCPDWPGSDWQIRTVVVRGGGFVNPPRATGAAWFGLAKPLRCGGFVNPPRATVADWPGSDWQIRTVVVRGGDLYQ